MKFCYLSVVWNSYRTLVVLYGVKDHELEEKDQALGWNFCNKGSAALVSFSQFLWPPASGSSVFENQSFPAWGKASTLFLGVHSLGLEVKNQDSGVGKCGGRLMQSQDRPAGRARVGNAWGPRRRPLRVHHVLSRGSVAPGFETQRNAAAQLGFESRMWGSWQANPSRFMIILSPYSLWYL